jgi:hypothetical protein
MKDESDPQHYTYKSLLSKHTWLQSCETPARVFVITRCETNWGTGDIEKLELLEMNSEDATLRDYVEVVNLVKGGKLRRTSKTSFQRAANM